MNVIKKSTFIYYFALYIALLFTWARQDFILMPIRLAYMALVFAPIAIKRVSLFFPCLVLFLTTSLLSFAGYTFMPTEPTIYLLITAIFSAIAIRERRDYHYPYYLFLLILSLTLCVNLLCSGRIEAVSYAFIFLLLLPITVSGKEKQIVLEIIPIVFIVSTTSTAILTLTNQTLLVQEMGYYERLMSGSINYTCCTLGIGFILALRGFVEPSTKKVIRVLYAFSMMVLLVTIITEASRGAILGVAVSSVLIIFNRQSKFRTRLLTVVLATLFIIIMYNNQIMDLLIYRFQSDAGTGTGRTVIWVEKLNQFYSQLSVPSAFFGIGFDKTWNLGGYGRDYIGCHNDFIAFFIEYGLFGIILFLTLILFPFRMAKTRSLRHEILPMVSYIFIVCMTLEPFSIGYLPFVFLLLYIYLIVCRTRHSKEYFTS